MIEYEVIHTFHPVGQGGFNAARIYSNVDGVRDRNCEFSFVHDCGTERSKDLGRLYAEIDDFTTSVEGEQIDLLAISHFDSDHVIGLEYLLRKKKVKTILLPYAPLHKRLEDAFATGVAPDAEEMAFFVNAPAFLAERHPGQVQELAYVLSGEPGEEPDITVLGPIDPDETDRKDVDSDRTKPSASEQIFLTSANEGGPNAILLDAGTPIMHDAIWAFQPYNDAKWKPKFSQNFFQMVNRYRNDLQRGQNVKQVLGALRTEYEKNFGTSSPARNRISLFIHSYAHTDIDTPIIEQSGLTEPGFPVPFLAELIDDLQDHPGRTASFLFTGDGDMRVRAFNRMCKHLFSSNNLRGVVLQVPHHGSKHNISVARFHEIKPLAIVICSGPNGHGHPHKSVEKVVNLYPHGTTGLLNKIEFSLKI